ncbi:MAG TPA: sulfurtransferase [Burkholderiaceae bacterium]|nr:sulfurtransferase [Burkholderiaceae bacterium]
MSDPFTSGTLVTVEQLRNHFEDPGWCVIDVRHDLMNATAGRRAYDAGHIPGAAFAHIDDDLSGAKNGRNGRHPLPRRQDLVQAFGRWGVDDDTQIVAYDAQGGNFAVRLWWLARWLGHARVAVLDGGWPAWLERTGLSSTEPPVRRSGHFSDRPSLMPMVEVDDVVRNLDSRARLVLDARTPERYRGEQEPIDPVAGHIPGARNRPWQRNLNPDQTFKPAAVLRQEFRAALGATAPAQVAHQCGSGVTACHNLLAMEIAGLTGSSLYPGSWSEWIADAARPVAVGNESPD